MKPKRQKLLPTLPATSLIVINAACPCRTDLEERECCGQCRSEKVNGEWNVKDCCSCHRLAQGVHVTDEIPFPPCKWTFHGVISGHQEFEMQSIRLMRECVSALAVIQFVGDSPLISEIERERILAARIELNRFLGEDYGAETTPNTD